MSTFVLVEFNIKNKEKLKEYSPKAQDSIVNHGGIILSKGPANVVHGRDTDFPMELLIEFPSAKEAIDWYTSSEYSDLKHVRDEAMDSRFRFIDKC